MRSGRYGRGRWPRGGRRIAGHGSSIGLISRNSERLESATEQVEQAGGRALPLACDVARADKVERAAERVENELGPIDVWVNCAMATIFAPSGEIMPEEFQRATALDPIAIAICGAKHAIVGFTDSLRWS